jgi:hypothetical protein
MDIVNATVSSASIQHDSHEQGRNLIIWPSSRRCAGDETLDLGTRKR